MVIGRFNHGGDGRMMSKKLGKRFLAGALAFAVALVGFTYVPKNAQAVENSPVKYQKVTLKDFKDKVGTTAPTYVSDDATDNTGYLFAGWYEIGDNDAVGKVIASADGITAEQVYAKFVPSYLAGIACQVDMNADNTKRNMRVVSLVHSQDYIAAGFNVYGRYDADGDGTNETEWVMYKYSTDPENPNKAQGTTVYQGLYQYAEVNGELQKQLKTPSDVFGAEAANDFYFTTVSITGIPTAYHDATMAVQPYWITKDGTYVAGMGEFNRINDYTNKIVNISVNLKEATAIAAGKLDITVPDGFGTLVEVERGRVFEEMESSVNGNTVKCVGNVNSLVNSTKANEVYVNLRFSIGSLSTLTKGATEFQVHVTEKSFCNLDEQFDKGVKAWNVRY